MKGSKTVAVLKERDIREIWECWWQKVPLTFCRDCKMPYGTSLYAIRKVIAAGVPDFLKDDDRSTGSFFSLFIIDDPGTLPTRTSQFVIMLCPMRMSNKVYRKGVNGLARWLRTAHKATLSSGNAPEYREKEDAARAMKMGYQFLTMKTDGTVVEGLDETDALVIRMRQVARQSA
ncbi:hypothetical protein [Gluconobacter potus]|uniref:hypothetical protein n=1 Tax=Gluconobacter potus TaxID=2724927 RepID=UPI0009BF1BA4|nr:hypothetical protein [Gluconobacter potus]